MRRLGIGVRWWLGAAFAVVAAATAASVVAVFSSGAQNSFRGRAEEVATGRAFAAAQRVAMALQRGAAGSAALAQAARAEHLDLFLYDDAGRLVAAHGTAPPGAGDPAAVSARAGSRYVRSSDNGKNVTVSVPLRVHGYAGLVARSTRSELPAELGIVRGQAVWAGVIAGLAGTVIGLVIAQLISLRLRRLAKAAEAVRSGDYDTGVSSRFPDEFGSVASAFERMRLELRRTFGRLEFERNRLRLLLERLDEGVITVDRNLTVRLANAEARRILGPRAVEGRPLPPAGPLHLRAVAERLFEDEASPEQRRVELEDGRTVSVACIPARTGAETAVLVLVDLTEASRREASEREFVANAAHELRTPLTTIIGAIEVLQAGAKEDPVQRDRFLAHIGREADRLARLARSLLVLARAQTRSEEPQLDAVDVRSLLEDIVLSLDPHDGVDVEVECPRRLDVITNRDLLEQAVRNLAENAAKHTFAGRIVLRATDAQGSLRIEVEDTGRGIALEAQRRIFERFARGDTRDSEGFGLGLAIVRDAVETLGGGIELDSAPGAGARFTILLPAARAQGVAA